MSGKVAKSQIPLISVARLPEDARVAVIRLKADIRQGIFPQRFGNRNRPLEGKGSPLPRLSDGCQYFEYPVGQAHPDDERPTGSHRLVAEVDVKGRRIREIYYTTQHYAKRSFRRVV